MISATTFIWIVVTLSVVNAVSNVYLAGQGTTKKWTTPRERIINAVSGGIVVIVGLTIVL